MIGQCIYARNAIQKSIVGESMELVYVSIISGLFGILGLLILNLSWYRKEKFKVEMGFLKKKNDLEFKRLAQEYGLPIKKTPSGGSVSTDNPPSLPSFLPELLSKLPPDTLADLAERFLPAPDEGGGGGITDQLMEFAQSNPEIVKSILGGIKLGAQEKTDLSSQV